MRKRNPDVPPASADAAQSRRFIEAARELGTDNDPERFKETVRKVAKAAPAKNAPHPRTSKSK
jgi:hypothetical protein